MRFLFLCLLLAQASVFAEAIHIKCLAPSNHVTDQTGKPVETFSHGHGVFIAADMLLTVSHVVTGDKIFFEYESKWRTATVIKRDDALDLVLLKPDEPVKKWHKLAKPAVIAHVAQERKKIAVTEWRITAVSPEFIAVGDEESPSGCPLINEAGEVAGIVTGVIKIDSKVFGAECASAAQINLFIKTH